VEHIATVGSNGTLAAVNISERLKNAIISGSGKCWVTQQRDDSEIVMNIRVLYDKYIKNSHNNLKISTDKTKIMAFKGKCLVRSKIEIDGSILEQVKKI